MKVTVLGAGAVGCLLAGLLSQRHEVSVIGRDEAVKAIEKNGLVVDGIAELKVRPKAYVDASGPGLQDLVVIAVKSYDLEQAIKDAVPLVAPWTRLLIVQNGLDVLKGARRLNGALVHIGVASLGVTLVSPGHVRYAGHGKMIIGTLNRRTALASVIAEEFKEAGLEATPTDDIITAVWRKAVINSAINPITAIVGRTNDCIILDEDLRKMSERLFDESMGVAVARRFLEAGSLEFKDVLDVVKATGSNRSSMLQDRERGRPTEIDAINGAICRAAPEPGMVLLNGYMRTLVKASRW